MKNIALFNLNGTIIEKDVFVEFLEFAKHKKLCRGNPLLRSTQILALKMGIIKQENYAANSLKGWSKRKFEKAANSFSETVLPQLITPEAKKRLHWHKKYQHEICIVTSSIDILVEPWAKKNGYKLIGSHIEEVNGKLTGNFLENPNRGFEKVNRIHSLLNLKIYDRVYAYVSSDNDKAMLRLGDEGYVNWTLTHGTLPVGVV